MKALMALAILGLGIFSYRQQVKIDAQQQQLATDLAEITTAYDKLAKYQSADNRQVALTTCMANAELKEQENLRRNATQVHKDGSMMVPVILMTEARQQKEAEINECRLLNDSVQ